MHGSAAAPWDSKSRAPPLSRCTGSAHYTNGPGLCQQNRPVRPLYSAPLAVRATEQRGWAMET